MNTELINQIFKDQEASTPSLKLSDAIMEFITYSRINHTDLTYENNKSLCNLLLNYFNNIDMDKVNQVTLERFIESRRDTVKNATINRALACLKKIYNLMRARDQIENTPFQNFHLLKEDQTKIQYLSEQEINDLISCRLLDLKRYRHYKMMILLALNTGMRLRETLRLTWRDVNMTDQVIIVTRTKNHKVRTIPINKTLAQYLKPKAPDEFVIGRKINSIRYGFQSVLIASGIHEPYTFHTLRHTFASRLVLANVNIVKVQKLLGHADLKTTMRYVHINQKPLREAVNKL